MNAGPAASSTGTIGLRRDQPHVVVALRWRHSIGIGHIPTSQSHCLEFISSLGMLNSGEGQLVVVCFEFVLERVVPQMTATDVGKVDSVLDNGRGQTVTILLTRVRRLML